MNNGRNEPNEFLVGFLLFCFFLTASSFVVELIALMMGV